MKTNPTQQPGILAQAAPQQPMDEEDPTESPVYLQAKDAVMGKLYDEGIAEDIAKALAQAPSVVQGLVDNATMLLNVSDEVTEQSIPDEAFMLFGLDLMGEVIEIAQAAGMQVGGREIAEATKQFITTTIENLGGDTADVKAAMQGIDTAQMGAALDELE